MYYMGSKARHAKSISPILMVGHNQAVPYIEPFVGGGNMICEIDARVRWGSDIAKDAVALLDALSKGWLPPERLSESEYYAIKSRVEDFHPALVGFAAYCCSYGGKRWGGYARGNDARDRQNEQARAVTDQAPKLAGVTFSVACYTDIQYPEGSTVYMDPPYAGTTKYKSGRFNHSLFWDFCAEVAKSCRVFVSEYTAPPSWTSVWEKSVANSLTKNTGATRGVEKLFVLN